MTSPSSAPGLQGSPRRGGVAAARRLSKSGLRAVVLEASARVGGRAWTQEVAGMALDLGCGWLHSAERNAWARIAEQTGFAIDRRTGAWGAQYKDRGFSAGERAAARRAYAAWFARLETAPPASDRAADALEPGCEWNGYIDAISGYMNGETLDRISVADMLAYDEAATDSNWRAPAGYGTLIAASLPAGTDLRLATPVERIALAGRSVSLTTRLGEVRASAAIVAISTAALASGAISLPPDLDPWLNAAAELPLGRNEKLFLEIAGQSPFAPESHVNGNPRDARAGSYYIRPFGRPVIECFLGGPGAGIVADEGLVAGFAHATEELAALFGADVRRSLKPLIGSNWARSEWIGGGYSHALPGRRAARADLARPFDGRIFFAGEATHAYDFSTAHGAHDTGVRAAEEAIAALKPGHASKSKALGK
jgi:monoamine oxidase